jgi:MoaA/NifB/PqqE/SkfB family radical SAM enzyme
MFYRLREQYDISVIDNCVYIISKSGKKCAYLNKNVAIVLLIIVNSCSLKEASERVDFVYKLSFDEAENIVNNIIAKLNIYLTYANDSQKSVEITKDILDKIFVSESRHGQFIKKDEYPKKIKFYLTDYCTRRCIYCFAGAKHIANSIDKVDNKFLSSDRFGVIIKEAEQIGVESIEIAGGDPLLLPNIEEYIRIMSELYSGEWSISTKSFIPEDRVIKLKNAGLKKIQISIDSFDEKIADCMMGCNGAFKEIIQTINCFLKYGIEVSLKAVITSLNIETIPDYFYQAMNIGIKEIRISYYYSSANRHHDSFYPTNEQFIKLNNDMLDVMKKVKANGVYTDFYYHNQVVEAVGDERIYCGGFTSSMAVRYDGKVLFCDSLNHSEDFAIGDMNTQGIMQIWNSKECDERGDPYFYYEKFKGTECYTCSLYNNCFYRRCFVRSYNKYGTYYEKDPACIKRDTVYYNY